MKRIVIMLVALLTTIGYTYTSFAQDKTDDKKCVMMKDGKMMVKEKGKKTPMTADMTMNDGTTVKTNGMVTRADGSTQMLADGEGVDMDGNMKMKDKDKMDKKKDKDMSK